MTISLDAFSRFFQLEEIENPKLVLVVGCVGLAFNIGGLFLFHQHDHGHSHGEEEGHAHDHNHDELSHAEAGHAHGPHSGEEHVHDHANGKADHDHKHSESDGVKPHGSVTFSSTDSTTTATSTSRSRTKSISNKNRRHSRSYSTIDSLPIHPASIRQDMRIKARYGEEDDNDYDGAGDAADVDGEDEVDEASPLLKKANTTASNRRANRLSQGDISHSGHKHNTAPNAKAAGGHGHDHDENVRGMFLHVLGDALGNVGVISAMLIIWLTKWPYRFYFDPIISLFIALIILKSAIPLVRDTARPLLQATPEYIKIQDIREDIESLPGIVSCHHIHVWALTRNKLIATLDVQLDFDFEGKGAERYMQLAKAIKSCLRGHNIYSSTVQPEFCMNRNHAHAVTGSEDSSGSNGSISRSDTGSSKETIIAAQTDGANAHPPCENGECLLEEGTKASMQCCAPGGGSGAVTPKKDKKDKKSHDHDHGHDHGHGHSHEH